MTDVAHASPELQVISRLSELAGAKASASGSSIHVPYRDSLLTRLLQTSLGGNTRTAVLCTVSPREENADESTNTLRFGARAKKVVNKAHVNEVMDDKAVIKQYEQDIKRLRKQLAKSKVGGHGRRARACQLRCRVCR